MLFRLVRQLKKGLSARRHEESDDSVALRDGATNSVVEEEEEQALGAVAQRPILPRTTTIWPAITRKPAAWRRPKQNSPSR